MSEKEYIERGALLKKFDQYEEQDHYMVAEEFPAADVEPVVRGEWVEGEHVGTDEIGVKHSTKYYICSECGFVSYSIIERCHGCFAHMERSGSGE